MACLIVFAKISLRLQVSLLLLIVLRLGMPTHAVAQLSARPKYHSYYHALALDRPTAADTVRLYIDRLGSIYPPAPYLPDASFKARKYKQALDEWFYAPKHKAQLSALEKYCGVAPLLASNGRAQHWEQIQDTLATRTARYLNQATRPAGQPGRRPLVALIHGFNNSEVETPFTGTYPALLHEPKLARAVWLEVRWDGLHKRVPVGIWGAAQLNGRYAGLALREVLCRTAPDTPIRMFTHSSGAIVASQALWNSQAGRAEQLKDDIRDLYQQIPTPTHPDIRVGMIVPAVPPDVFYNYPRRTVGLPSRPAQCQPGTGPAYRVVLGQNARDFAVSKGGIAAGGFGVTTLGCEETAFLLARDSCRCGLQKVEFSQASGGTPSPPPYGVGKKLEQHDWALYWRRPQSRDFLRLVLAD